MYPLCLPFMSLQKDTIANSSSSWQGAPNLALVLYGRCHKGANSSEMAESEHESKLKYGILKQMQSQGQAGGQSGLQAGIVGKHKQSQA